MHLSFTTFCLLLAISIAGSPSPSDGTSGLVVLEARDPVGDQEHTCRPDRFYPAGDLKGARLVLRKIPLRREERTAPGSEPACVYLPVELTVRIDRELEEGEVQLCIFIHLPPIHIEHIISRDSFLMGEPPAEERLVLTTQSEISLFTGMEKTWDDEVTAFMNSPAYQNCRFSAPPEERAEAIEEAEKFGIHHGDTYRLPPSPTFYWRDIPRLKISTSLVVRNLDGLTVRGIRELLNDTLETSWEEGTDI